jgi:precorrin-6A/cobalt-precorrin-6A reductase
MSEHCMSEHCMTKSFNVLILGGTRNARDLAILLSNNGQNETRLDVMTSLAGRTQEPDRTFGNTRIGGFGGAEGLAKYLREEKIDLLVDSTHPFATRISQNAAEASKITGVNRLILNRPKWEKHPGDIWIACKNLDEAAQKLPGGAVAFLALGHQHLNRFSTRGDVRFIARMLDEPQSAVQLPNHALVIGKPSHLASDEAQLFIRHAITHLVCRNSGGTLIYAKIEAARLLKLPILMIARPPSPTGNCFDNIAELASEIIRLSA